MPIKSQAQRRKFAELLMKGEISEEVYERWNREAGYRHLPERVTPKGKSKGKRKTAARTKAAASKRKGTAPRRKSTTKKRSIRTR